MDENANLGFNCTISSTNKVQVGKDNIIAAYTYLLGGGSYEFDDVSTPIRENYDYTGKGGVSTGENVWIGAHVTVLDGVSIGSGCVVGAGSVVSHSIESDSVAAGTPAKVLRKRRTTDSG